MVLQKHEPNAKPKKHIFKYIYSKNGTKIVCMEIVKFIGLLNDITDCTGIHCKNVGLTETDILNISANNLRLHHLSIQQNDNIFSEEIREMLLQQCVCLQYCSDEYAGDALLTDLIGVPVPVPDVTEVWHGMDGGVLTLGAGTHVRFDAEDG